MISLLSTFIGPLMPFLIKAIIKHMEKKEYTRETKKKFLAFSLAWASERGSAELSRTYEDLLKQAENDTSF